MKHYNDQESKQSKKYVTRILGIAPYEGLKKVMEKAAATRDDVELEVCVGDMSKGLEMARSRRKEDYDVIISRGGTARMLKEAHLVPLVEINLSVYDILRAIKLAENYSDRYAVVGFPSITKNAHLLCDLLQYELDIFTIHDTQEALDTLKELKRNGYHMIVCDMISNTTAKRMGLNTILITSGLESVAAAFDEAVALSKSYLDIRMENQLMKQVVSGSDLETVLLDEDGDVVFSSVQGEIFDNVKPMLTKELHEVLSKRTKKFFRNVEGTQYAFTCRALDTPQERYGVFYFSSNSIPFATSKYGIQYSNQQEAEDRFFSSFYSITNAASGITGAVDNLNLTGSPVMLTGEVGSGKEQVARIIYTRSTLSANPLITINCSLLNDRSWNFLINHFNSPFNDNNNTIFLKDFTTLDDTRRRHLLSVIIDTNLCKRNRLMFSCTCEPGRGMPAEALEYVNELSCVAFHLTPLREHKEEIPSLCSLYLNTINVTTANQIIGLEPKAMKLMTDYDWPYNYTQFKRILNELAIMTTTPYIKKESVEFLLMRERETMGGSLAEKKEGDKHIAGNYTRLDLTKSLEDIIRDVINIVIDESGGNQSKAAKRLGIGRTTLWRYLK